MSINAADIMRQAYEAAEKVKDSKLSPEEGVAVAALVGKQVDVMRTVIDYLRLSGDTKLAEVTGGVFTGSENPRAITHRKNI